PRRQVQQAFRWFDCQEVILLLTNSKKAPNGRFFYGHDVPNVAASVATVVATSVARSADARGHYPMLGNQYHRGVRRDRGRGSLVIRSIFIEMPVSLLILAAPISSRRFNIMEHNASESCDTHQDGVDLFQPMLSNFGGQPAFIGFVPLLNALNQMA
ncbi:MAG: hypothetical protein ACRC6D_11335, partial [Aeromonas sp.]